MRTCSYSHCKRPFQPKFDGQRHCSTPCRDRMLGRQPRVRRGTTCERGYNARHRKLRAELLPNAYYTPCTRCGQLMLPGQELHLDHDDNDRTQYRGFSHAKCNVSAGAVKGNRQRVQRYTSSTPRIAR